MAFSRQGVLLWFSGVPPLEEDWLLLISEAVPVSLETSDPEAPVSEGVSESVLSVTLPVSVGFPVSVEVLTLAPPEEVSGPESVTLVSVEGALGAKTWPRAREQYRDSLPDGRTGKLRGYLPPAPYWCKPAELHGYKERFPPSAGGRYTRRPRSSPTRGRSGRYPRRSSA